MKYTVVSTSQFKRDLRLVEKQGRDVRKLERIIELLASGVALPKKNRDHALKGNLRAYRECHVESDWLLLYKIDVRPVNREADVMILSRTGTHSVLLGI